MWSLRSFIDVDGSCGICHLANAPLPPTTTTSHKWVGNISNLRQKYTEEPRRKISLWRHRFKGEGALAPHWQPLGAGEHHLVTNLPRGESVLLPRVMMARGRLASTGSKNFCEKLFQSSTSCIISWNVECGEWQEGKLEFTFTAVPSFAFNSTTLLFSPRNWRTLRCWMPCQVGRSACLMGAECSAVCSSRIQTALVTPCDPN